MDAFSVYINHKLFSNTVVYLRMIAVIPQCQDIGSY